jgi:hypothetical protein
VAARTKKKKVLDKALDIKAPAAGDPNLQRKLKTRMTGRECESDRSLKTSYREMKRYRHEDL